MSRAVYEERQAKKLKDLINWAKTFLFKNQNLANSYETPESVELSNYYISCRNDSLPYIYKYDRKGFPEDLNEYNLMPDGQQFFIDAYELNTKYVADSESRFKEVRGSVHNKNKQMVDPPYMGNIFELNAYYRGLYCYYGLDIMTTRNAKDYSILDYDENYLPEDVNAEVFLDLYTENREWFASVMENQASMYDDMHRKFNCLFITLMTIFSYLDTELQKQFSYDLLDQYDIRNALYSFGITFLNDLPLEFQLRVLRNIRALIKNKGTDNVYKIITEDIFNNNIAKIYKYYLCRDLGFSESEKEAFNNGTMSYEEYKEHKESANLYFVKVPYDVYDVEKYLGETPAEDIIKIPFEDITSKDAYWNQSYDADVVKDKIGDRSYIESKYIAINTEIANIPDVQGLLLFFSMLHETKNSFPIRSNSLKDPSLDLFGLFACALYLTKMNIDTNISDDIPPNAKNISTVLATYLYDLNNVYKENNKYKSLTLDVYNKNNYNYWQKEDYEFDSSLKSTKSNNNFLYYGFAQHFKDNFEVLKGLNNALMAVSYDDDDITGIDIPENSEEFPADALLSSLISKINRYYENRSLVSPTGHEDSYAEILYSWLKDNNIEVDKFKHVPWLKTIIEHALLIKNEEALFESRNEFSNRYGYYENMSIEEYLILNHPKAYNKIADAILGDKKTRMDLLMNLYDDIMYTLSDVYVYSPPPNGKKTKLTEDVNFKAFLQDYIIIYAVKLLDYLKSYTVQLHSSGTVYDLTNKGQSTIQMHDIFTGDIHRKKILGEYIFTGKYPWLHDPSKKISQPYFDTDRIGLNLANTTHERVLDEVQVSITKIANQKSYLDNNGMLVIDTDKRFDNVPQDGGYGNYENSLSFKEQLFCRVITPTSEEVSKYPLYKKDVVISVVGGPVMVSSTSNETKDI